MARTIGLLPVPDVKPMKDFIAYADGKNDLIDISNIIQVPVRDLLPIVAKLSDNGLLEEME